MTPYKVGYLVGSLAKASINRLLATALVRLAPAELEMSEISFKDLPLYSYDYDANYPPVATAFKDAIAAVDAVLFVTPEYNRSIPGGVKNAIDWASRPPARTHSRVNRRASLGHRRAKSARPSPSSICAAFSPSAIHRS
jgi:chromate reductase